MTLTSGSRLGPYEIVGPLGVGGMGEVYKAKDTRLDRIVAIKVLPPQFAADSQFRERFEREAKTVSQLTHPHICTLYDVGHHDDTSFLVLEYLQGQTLADRLTAGALPLDQALQYAIQIADALDKAHHAGVVHRDLKPGNIMLTKSGAKLLDFGLAKITRASVAASGLSIAPTDVTPVTLQGTILGTLQYMAPEQIEGQDADARTDIFAFGCVLYEMFTGRKAFEGKTQASLISAILKDTPSPISVLQSLASHSVDRLVRKCLAKDPDDRWQTARDLLDELKWAAEARFRRSEIVPVAGVRRGRFSSTRLAWVIAVMAFAVATAAVWQKSRQTPAPRPIARFTIAVPPTESPTSLAVSPDGRQLVYVATTEGQSRLWVRLLDDPTPRVLAGTEGASFPFWAPDARAVGFFTEAKLKRVDVAGGIPLVLADAPNGRGGTWNSDGVILFTPGNVGSAPNCVITRISAAGGTPMAVTHLAAGEGCHRWPQFLPDGHRFIFFSTLGRSDTQGVYLASIDGGTPARVLATETPGVFVPPDRLLLVRGDALMAARFDAARGTVVGDLMPLAQPVGRDDGVMASAFSVSPGTLAYRATGGSQRRQLVWMDRTGKMVDSIGSPDTTQIAQLALDRAGQHIAINAAVSGNFDIWLVDASRSSRTRFTFDPAPDLYPLWSPDGSRVIFRSTRRGPSLYERTASGAGDERVLLAVDAGVPLAWSPDGRFVLYSRADPKTGTDLWVLPMTGEQKPHPVVQTAMEQPGGEFSPDGRWLAYQSNESGQFEVYVQPFPEAGGKWQVTTAGGTQPRWRRDGKELYYVAPDARLVGVPVAPSEDGKTLGLGMPVPLFRTRLASGAGVTVGRPEYDVAPDGRFLMNIVVDDTAPEPMTIVLNWESGLRR